MLLLLALQVDLHLPTWVQLVTQHQQQVGAWVSCLQRDALDNFLAKVPKSVHSRRGHQTLPVDARTAKNLFICHLFHNHFILTSP